MQVFLQRQGVSMRERDMCTDKTRQLERFLIQLSVSVHIKGCREKPAQLEQRWCQVSKTETYT